MKREHALNAERTFTHLSDTAEDGRARRALFRFLNNSSPENEERLLIAIDNLSDETRHVVKQALRI